MGTKAQSEIGPTSYVEGEGIIEHGPNDPETKAAYAGGDPKVPGTENLRRDAAEARQAAPRRRSTKGSEAAASDENASGTSGASGGELVDAGSGARKGRRKAAGGARGAGKQARMPRAGSRKRS